MLYLFFSILNCLLFTLFTVFWVILVNVPPSLEFPKNFKVQKGSFHFLNLDETLKDVTLPFSFSFYGTELNKLV